MEAAPVRDSAQDHQEQTMVDLVLQPASAEGDGAKTESHGTPQDDRDASDTASSSKERLRLEGPVAEFEGKQPVGALYSEETEPVTIAEKSRTHFGDRGHESEDYSIECDGESLLLKDGACLQGETDVDIVAAKDLSAGEVVNKFHNVADLSSMSPSISTDKTITSSTLSSCSVDGDSLRSIDPVDSSLSPSRMLARGLAVPSVGTSDRTVLSASVHNSEMEDSDNVKTEDRVGKQKGRNVGAGNEDTITAGDSTSPQTDSHLSPPQRGESSDVGETSDRNHPNSNDAHLHENGDSANHVPMLEPFSCFVDVSRLCTDLGTGSRASGNVQEQQLQTLVNSAGDPHSWKQLKKLLRSGSWAVQSTVRKVAWLEVCSHLHKLEKAYVYIQMEKEMFGDVEDEDVPVPTWPHQPSQEEHLLTEYYLTPKGKNTAHKIVAIIGQLSPDISYCPGLMPLVDLFLHYMEAADCFSCVLTLLQSKGPVYLMQSRVAFEASKRVVKDLAKKYAKSAYVSLVRNCSNVDAVFDNWMGWIYSDLPFSYVVAMTDSFLLEGIKVLYRVVLAILILYTKRTAAQGQRQAATAPANVTRSISQFCQNLPVPPAKLLKVAFRIRSFSRKKLQKLLNHHEGLITSGALNAHADMPRIASKLSMEHSMAMSMAHANTKMMGFHDTGSNILSVDQLVTLWSWLPSRYAICPPTMLFNSADLGTSLMTLYTHIELEPCTVMVIKTVEGEVFGAFCADPWVERRTYSRPVRFFGTGETFLFTLVPERVKYEWVGKPDPHVPLSANMFQAGDNTSLLIGGGSGSGIQLDGMMERCRTETCDTFNNPPLCAAQDFVPSAIEVFGMSL